MKAFPDLCPVARRYTPGKYATRRYQSISGAGSSRLYGNKAFDAELELEFLCTDIMIVEIAESWHVSKGGFYPTPLPDGVLGEAKFIIPGFLEWRWADEPSIQSVQPDLSRVGVRFIATLESR